MYEPAEGALKPPVFTPMDKSAAASILKEARCILDQEGVVFFLRHGTALGAVRDSALIEWDDDLDIGSIIGMHGLTEEAISPVAERFREHGFTAIITEAELHISVELSRDQTQLDWTCYRVIDGSIYQWPVVEIPARLHEELKPIEFLGETFYVPNPPEEYLRLKYGPEWMLPKQTGFEQDILDLMPEERSSRLGGVLGALRRWMPGQRSTGLVIADQAGAPVPGAEVVMASTTVLSGRTRLTADRNGKVRLPLPEDGYYVLTIRHGDHEEILFMERLVRGAEYVYRPDPEVPAGRVNVLETYRQAAAGKS